MLADRVVVITGGAGLLGREFAAEVARQGGVAIIADIDAQAANGTARQIRDLGGRAEGEPIDITDRASIERLIAAVVSRHGCVHAVVNNAYPRNRNYGRRLEEVTYADFCENVGLHLGGYFLVAQAFAEHFRSSGGGNIVNIGSVYGVIAPRFALYDGTSMTMPVEYAAIKAGVIHLTKYFAQYFRAADIRCNCLSPGGIRDRQPDQFIERYNAHCGSRGMLEPRDLVGALTFLLSDASQPITGQNLVVDDGFTL